MARKPVRSVRLTARISESTAEKEDVDFVEKKLRQGMAQATFVRQAVQAYRRLEEGDFVEEIARALRELEPADDEAEKGRMEREKIDRVKKSIAAKIRSDSFL